MFLNFFLLQARFPHLNLLLQKDNVQRVLQAAKAHSGDASGAGGDADLSLSIAEFAHVLRKADAMMKSHPATAQVATQQGKHLAKYLNGTVKHPFRYRHLGSFANLGGEQAALELPGDMVSAGVGTMWLWYCFYASDQLSWRNRWSVLSDWGKKKMFGRDCSRL